MRMPLHTPVVDDHAMFADHDQACAICWSEHAVLEMNPGVFQPCWACQEKGWSLRHESDSLTARLRAWVKG